MRAHQVYGVQVVSGVFRTLPTGQEYDSRDSRRHIADHATNRGLGNPLHAFLTRAFHTGNNHIRLQQHTLEQHAVGIKLGEHCLENPGCDNFAAFDVVGTIHEYFRFHDRHDIQFLADRGVTRQDVGIRTNTERGRNIALVDLNNRLLEHSFN